MKEIYHYTVYGLQVASEIYCPELCPAEGKPDVSIRYGSLKHIRLNGDYHEARI